MRVCVLLQDLEERLRQQHHMELQSLREAHRQKIETLKQQSEQELQTLRFELEDEGKAMLGKGHGDEAQAERTYELGQISKRGYSFSVTTGRNVK